MLVGVFVGSALAVESQTPVSLPTMFDVVSIHKSDSSTSTENLNYDHGRISGEGLTIAFLLEKAFGVRDFQIDSVPSRLEDQRYDIIAKMDDPSDYSRWEKLDSTTQQKLYQLRLESILADRFQLRYHLIERRLPGFELKVGRSGAKMKESSDTEGYLRMHKLPDKNIIEGDAASLSDLASLLSNVVQRDVVDETALTGKYTFEVSWASDGAPKDAAPMPSLYTAIKEELGLTLDRVDLPTKVYVVDHIQNPSPN